MQISTLKKRGLMRRRLFLAAGSAAALAGSGARAAIGGLPTNVGHADSSPEWEKLRGKLFGTRPIEADPAKSQIQLIVPLRAAYGASVPVKIVSKLAQSSALSVKRITLLVDKNPSAVAAVIDITPEVGQADFETRIRVDEYGHVRVVSELSDGTLHTDSRYCKVSGGCSAPPNRDQMNSIGKTLFKLPEAPHVDAPTVAEVTVLHPNDTGFELNNVTVMFIPPYFVRSLKVKYADRLLFDADLDFSISENPTFRFNFVPHGEGLLQAEVEDSKELRYTGSLPVRLT